LNKKNIELHDNGYQDGYNAAKYGFKAVPNKDKSNVYCEGFYKGYLRFIKKT